MVVGAALTALFLLYSVRRLRNGIQDLIRSALRIVLSSANHGTALPVARHVYISPSLSINKKEARHILARELAKYRRESYADLQRLLEKIDTYEVMGPSGASYQKEIQAVWDDRTNGNLRVVGGIDDGGWPAYRSLTDDFILSPFGKFIDE